MLIKKQLSVFNKPILEGLLVFLLVLLISQTITYQKLQLKEQSEKNDINQRVSRLKEDLQNVLGQSYNVTQTLAFIVDNYGIPENFDSIAKLLLNSNKNIDALELVNSEGVITHVYPLKGNEVLGLNILNDVDNKFGARITLEKKDYYTAGPIHLTQGGSGIIGRRPLYKEGEFNGFVAAVVRLSTVVPAIQIDSLGDNQFSYQLSKINLDKTEEVFYSTNTAIGDDALSIPLTTSKGEWKLYVIYNKTTSDTTIILFSILGLLLSFVSGILVWQLARQPQKLTQLVDEKTALLKESRERYKLLVEQASDGIFLSDMHGNLTDANTYGVQLFGYDKSELLNKNLNSLITADNLVKQPLRHAEMELGDTVLYDRVLIKKDGTPLNVEVSAKKINETTILGIVRDSTVRKELEKKVHENLQKFSKAFNSGFVGMVIKDENNCFVDANDYFLNLIGYSLDEIKGKSIPEIGLVNIEEALKTNPAIKNFASTERVGKIEVDFTTKQGEIIHVITSMEPYEYQGKKYSLSTYVDQTEIKKATFKIIQSEKKYRQLTERISDAYISFDKDWNFISINSRAAKIVGMDPIEMIGKNLWKEFPEFKNSEAYAFFKGAMARQIFTHFEQYHEKFGRWLENYLYPSPNGLSIYFRDVTRKKKEELEKQKLIAIIENSPGFIGLANLDGEALFINDAGKKLVNFPSDKDITTTSILDFFTEDYQKIVLQEHLPAIKNTGVWTGEVPFKNFDDDSTVPLEFSGFIISDKNNEPIGIGSIGFDLTERKKAQEEILDLQSKMDAAIRIGKIGYWDFNIITETFICSPIIYDIYDISQDEDMTIDLLESLIHPDDLEKHRQNLREIITEALHHSSTYRIIVRDGSIRHLLVEMEVVRNKENLPIKFWGTVIDITKQKEADYEIIELQSRMDAAIRIGKIGYWDFELATQKITWSSRMYEIYEIKKDVTVTLELLESLIHPDDLNSHRDVVERIAIENKTHSLVYRIIVNDGSIKYISVEMETQLDANNNPARFIGTVIDITEQKESEIKILDLQSKMNAAIRIGQFGYWNWEMDKDTVEWSKEMYKIHHVDPSIIMTPELVRDIIYHDDYYIIENKITESEENKSTSPTFYRILLKDNTFRHFLAFSEIIYDVAGKPIRYHGTAMDITKSVIAEKALKESEEKFAKAFETNYVGMLLMDTEQIIIEANETVCTLLNTSKKELIGKKIMDTGVVTLDDYYLEKRKKALASFFKDGKQINEEFKVTLKNGQKKTLLVSKEFLQIKDSPKILVTLIDDTQRKEAEEAVETQYLELKKTNSELDSFVYSASHELRAPLASVLGLIQLTLLDEQEPQLKLHLNMMEKSIVRLDDFIKDIIEYSRNKHVDIKLVTINFINLIENSIESFWYLENTSKINIDIDVNDAIEFVSDSKRISILLNNFISNAIKYHDLNKKSPSIWVNIKTSKKEAIIIIKDNGVGIENDQLDKIFDMFYRVSSKVMGTGIGLFIVKEVLSKLNGSINVESKIGEGSTFTLKIPNESKRK
ncbi:PAS domain S-box protein [Maribacter hydrothermalis]|uniref:histidine kinase n=1 Tax=Maribacter hydrothermalis TaxID=1836467 RepID=A0A1B7Z4S9_9FLAO|nr:PAS domain S-box protein [Maribacter hydrothermalis]APQ17300.1 hypothetical protein BTR34_08170 [Maribacter hydrothermalis]OBR37560.1 hypothetical protein A9200_07920 [Maribacter hydrothermalis]